MNARVDRWRSSLRGWIVTAAVLAAIVCLACWPRPTLGVLGIVVGTGALLAGLRGLLVEQRGRAPAGPSRRHALAFNALSRVLSDNQEFVRLSVRDKAAHAVLAALDTDAPATEDDDLAAQEARDLADDLGRELYLARDARAFVEECCDIADREGQQPTTTAVREWLRGAQCARQAGLVLDPEASGRTPETARTPPDATRQQDTDQAGDHPDERPEPPALDDHPRDRLCAAFIRLIRDSAASVIAPGAMADVALAELAPELDELAALHQGEEPYTDDRVVPTPAQWIWRWNRATPTERLEYAARALARTDRLAAVYAVLIHASGRSDLTADDINARVRAALDGEAGR